MFRLLLPALVLTSYAAAEAPLKRESTLYPAEVVARVREQVRDAAWGASVREDLVQHAAFWREMDDEALWSLMFGPTLERSWMVWSNGHSPVTGEPVPMYNWVVKAQEMPWKLQDPTSGEWFPKNDFKAFYDSGLNARGIFEHARADRSLLFNTEHPDPADPLHLFGVDDGTGYVNAQGERWRFVATYLIYGQWKQLVLGGIRGLGAAYLVTGDPVYARKAGILIDRVADLYPEFDFKTQAILYEGPGSAGYVSTWHDTCEETREMVMAYDMVFDALKEDAELVRFLAAKASAHGLENPKTSFADIQRNIETRILRDALANPEKIHSNYPRAEILKAIITRVLPESEEAFWAIAGPMLERATAVDGVTGEKGLAGYSAYVITALANFLAEFSKSDPGFLLECFARAPRLRETYRFFIDTLCLQQYYPHIGDDGYFAGRYGAYAGMHFLKPGGSPMSFSSWTILPPSNYRLLWQLYEITGDPAYVQVLYMANGYRLDGLPHDVFGEDSTAFQARVAEVIAREGTLIAPGSVNKQEWRLAILRGGAGAHERALWIDYDAGGGHGHQDGLNLGLYAHGLDFMPEFGYPPVQFGGWGAPRARWYTMTAAHNTVVVDGKNQPHGAGETTLWGDGQHVRAIRVRGEAMNHGNRYERTAILVEVDAAQFYVVDVFRVAGGQEHTKFQHSHFGTLSTERLTLQPTEPYGHDTQMRDFHLDPGAPPGWQAHWQIEDRHQLLAAPEGLGMHYWDFTAGAAAGTAEAWIVPGLYEASEEVWIPRLFVRRTGDGATPLESTFVAVVQPYRGQGSIEMIERLPVSGPGGGMLGDTHVALRITHTSGVRDLILIRDPEETAVTSMELDGTHTDAELALIRVGSDGRIPVQALANGSRLRGSGSQWELGAHTAFAESVAQP